MASFFSSLLDDELDDEPDESEALVEPAEPEPHFHDDNTAWLLACQLTVLYEAASPLPSAMAGVLITAVSAAKAAAEHTD